MSAADWVRVTGLLGVAALLCATGLMGAAELLWPNWLPVLNVGDGGGSEALHPAKSMTQQIALASTNPLIIGRLIIQLPQYASFDLGAARGQYGLTLFANRD